MKRLVIALAAAALILAPMSASALEMMSDSNMNDVTGQAGVSIALDDVVLFQDVGKTVYTDKDGYEAQYDGVTTAVGSTNTGQASVFISDQQQMTFINAIGANIAAGTNQANHYKTNFNYLGGLVGGTEGGLFQANFTGEESYVGTQLDNALLDPTNDAFLGQSLQGLTIDVGTCALLQTAYNYAEGTVQTDGSVAPATNRIAGVIIGLPNLEIVSSTTDKSIGVQTEGDTAANGGMEFIQISEEASTTAILDGYVEIAPH